MTHSICQQIWKTHQWSQDWKRSVFIQIPKKANAKDVQTTIQLCSFHMLAQLCSKSFKLGFRSTWTEDFKLYKLDLEKAEGPEIKLPTSVGSWRKQRGSRKTSTSASLTTLKPLTVWVTANWKILKEIGVLDHLTCLLRNLYSGQGATVRTRHETTDWFQTGKGGRQGCVLSLIYKVHILLFHLYVKYIMQNARQDESQAGIKTARRNINNLRYTDDTTLMAKSEEELKKPLDEGERGEWKSWLATQH